MKLRSLTASAFLLGLLAIGAAGTQASSQVVSHAPTAAADPTGPNPVPPPPGPSF